MCGWNTVLHVNVVHKIKNLLLIIFLLWLLYVALRNKQRSQRQTMGAIEIYLWRASTTPKRGLKVRALVVGVAQGGGGDDNIWTIHFGMRVNSFPTPLFITSATTIIQSHSTTQVTRMCGGHVMLLENRRPEGKRGTCLQSLQRCSKSFILHHHWKQCVPYLVHDFSTDNVPVLEISNQGKRISGSNEKQSL